MTRAAKHFPHKNRNGTAGNAMIYVLIVVALFGALTFVLARQHGAGEIGTVNSNSVDVTAAQILQVSNQVKQAVDQMLYSGSHIEDLDFTQPHEAGFAAGTNTRQKVFHPDGGGVVMPQLGAEAITQIDTNPAPGWYMGAFNNVEWTPLGPASPGAPLYTDVILVAHQINKQICAKINEMVTGSATIPAVSVPLARVLIDASRHSAGANVDLDATNCPGCVDHPSLCVSNAGATMFSFYNVIEQR